MPSPTTEEIIDLVTRRWDVLESLSDRALSKPELEATLGVSRSTVDRAIGELEAASMVVRDPSSGYRLTELGRPVYRLCKRTRRCLDAVTEAHSHGSAVPSGANGELPMYDGARLVSSEPHVPDKPLQHLLDTMREAESLRGYTPVVLQQYVEVCHKHATRREADVELVVPPQVHQCLRTTYPDEYRRARRASCVRLHETSASLPFGLLLFGEGADRTCALVSYSKAGATGVLFNDTASAIGWATQTYRELKADSTPVDQPKATQ
ncbi:helix-turn-helix transcriptional regulator [Haloferax volcanii]|uniref:HTH domain protein n=3 Tax=Haloferax volcanii TaxID=2246 RepID=D4GQY9_HALVD|nr:MarR family transcriptional regulator [Haloferax volcanii]ADE02208.1 HTH domain protein [Haloferax volcanii DS2]ELY31432.1 hypothetical protein C498_10201 [Haloferax volcanii DS2]MBS8120755.1 MarR family transcriptional regulator [Haloferax volcanii]MBS8125792.1 MarR family transcriptional regulator [Haloferax volcanii]MBS8129576.1 MarR family transcriptional regulator [Haloferax volcanii]